MNSTSSLNKKISSEYDHHTSEESGWTAYLEDFSLNQKQDMSSSSSSLVSDAAWNGFDYKINGVKKLTFKNSRKSNYKKFSCDSDDLEDTASSPVNSPKVSTMKMQMEVNYRRTEDDRLGLFLEKQAGFNNQLSEGGIDEKNRKNTINGRENEYIDLKKRGLCLVPVSVLMNYVG